MADLLVCCIKWKMFGRKTVFYDELKGEWVIHSVDDLVMCLGDFNGHVDWNIDGFDGVHTMVLSVERFRHVKCMIEERGKDEGDIQTGRK